jgi:ligand-binding sensor domain-containing protein
MNHQSKRLQERMLKIIAVFILSIAGVELFNIKTNAGQFILKKEWLEGSWSHYTTDNGLSSNTVLSIAVEGKYIWFGTYGGGASCYDKDSGQWKAYTTKWEPALSTKTKPGLYWENTLEDNHVTAIAVDVNSDVWFGTTFYGYNDLYGASRFTRNPSPKWTVYGLYKGLSSDDVTSIAVDADFVWIGTQKGLARFSKKTETWSFFNSPQQLPDRYINSVTIDSQEVWLGTASGIAVLSKKTGTWKFYAKKDGLPEDSIQAVAVEGMNIWAGGTYGSLAVFNKEERVWKIIKTDDGLDEKWIKSIVNDGRHIWIARDGGVSCYNIATGKWLALTSEDGLIGHQVNAIAIDGSTVWFGTEAGVSKLTLNN